MKRAVVIGAGLAGLNAALQLLDRGVSVTVLEASRHLGGRCRSWADPELGLLDNGTHALIGANRVALRLIDRIGTAARWTRIRAMDLRVADLATGRVLHPLRRFAGIALGDLVPLLRLAGSDRPLAGLFAGRGSGAFYRAALEPFAVAALNTPATELSSRLLGRTLWIARGGLAVHVAERGIGPDLVEPLADLVRRSGGTIRTGTRARAVTRGADAALAIDLAGETLDLGPDDGVVVATPFRETARLLGLQPQLEASPIVNAHFALGRAVPGPPRLVGVLGGKAQWVLVRDRVLSVTISAADALVDRPADELAVRLWQDVRRCAAALDLAVPASPTATRVVKERAATIRQRAGLRRPGPLTAWRNLVLAGDWLETGLPATIEGALRSGARAADVLLASGQGRAWSRHRAVPAPA